MSGCEVDAACEVEWVPAGAGRFALDLDAVMFLHFKVIFGNGVRNHLKCVGSRLDTSSGLGKDNKADAWARVPFSFLLRHPFPWFSCSLCFFASVAGRNNLFLHNSSQGCKEVTEGFKAVCASIL